MPYLTAGKRLSGDAFTKDGQAGRELVSFTSKSSTTQAVTFPIEFDDEPSVTVNIASGAAATAQWFARAITITTTGFTLFLFSGSETAATWSDITVTWIAKSP